MVSNLNSLNEDEKYIYLAAILKCEKLVEKNGIPLKMLFKNGG